MVGEREGGKGGGGGLFILVRIINHMVGGGYTMYATQISTCVSTCNFYVFNLPCNMIQCIYVAFACTCIVCWCVRSCLVILVIRCK